MDVCEAVYLSVSSKLSIRTCKSVQCKERYFTLLEGHNFSGASGVSSPPQICR